MNGILLLLLFRENKRTFFNQKLAERRRKPPNIQMFLKFSFRELDAALNKVVTKAPLITDETSARARFRTNNRASVARLKTLGHDRASCVPQISLKCLTY